MIQPTEDVQKAWKKLRKNDLECMATVKSIWIEISHIQNGLTKKHEEYPYGLSLDFYNKHQSFLQSLLNDKMEELEFMEKMIDAENTKYKSLV